MRTVIELFTVVTLMKINRRSFLTTGALSAVTFKSQPQNNQQVDAPARTKEPRIITHLLKDAGSIPNSRLPVLIYQGALDLPKANPAATIEALLHAHDWSNTGATASLASTTITAQRTKRYSFTAVQPKYSWAVKRA